MENKTDFERISLFISEAIPAIDRMSREDLEFLEADAKALLERIQDNLEALAKEAE